VRAFARYMLKKHKFLLFAVAVFALASVLGWQQRMDDPHCGGACFPLWLLLFSLATYVSLFFAVLQKLVQLALRLNRSARR